MPYATSRRLLQIAIALGGLVPVGAGLAGVVLGAGMTGNTAPPDLDSHLRYLSGLLLGIGLLFWSTIPKIEARGTLFLSLTAIVFTGGLARLVGLLHAVPHAPMLAALVMELVVTPLLCGWQRRLRPAEPARQVLPGATADQTNSGDLGG